MPWTKNDIPNLGGRRAVVTGANSGIGFEAALGLAEKGAHVVLACRSRARADEAAAAIRARAPGADLDIVALDLSHLASVRAFADDLRRRHERLDLLVNNAGVMALPYRKTADGFEMQFGTNHLGHFALTGLLFDLLLATPGARVVNVSSHMHRVGRIRFDDLHWERGYGKWRAYGQSKVANLLFSHGLHRRLRAAGAGAIVASCHPGYAATHLQAAGPEMEGAKLTVRITDLGNRLFAQSAAMGALPTLYAATAPGVRCGDYVGPGGLLGMAGHPQKVGRTRYARRDDVAERLWQESERLTGVTFRGL